MPNKVLEDPPLLQAGKVISKVHGDVVTEAKRREEFLSANSAFLAHRFRGSARLVEANQADAEPNHKR
jgi:hypothetical protein